MLRHNACFRLWLFSDVNISQVSVATHLRRFNNYSVANLLIYLCQWKNSDNGSTFGTRHGNVLAAAVVNDEVGFTLSETTWLSVVIRRFTVAVRTRQVHNLHVTHTHTHTVAAIADKFISQDALPRCRFHSINAAMKTVYCQWTSTGRRIYQ